MKRVLLIRNVMPEMYGGGETYQLKLGELLKKSGFEPVIISSSRELLRVAKDNGFETIKAPFLKQQNWSGWRNILFPIYWFKMMKLRKWYRKIFEEYKPEVINIQSRDDWIAATTLAKKKGIRVLWTDHMDFRSWVLTNVEIWYKNWIGKWLLQNARKADKIIMISDYEKKSFDKITERKRFNNVVVIKNGADDDSDKFKKTEAKKNSFCYIGRIVDYKGIGEMVEAFKMVAEKHKDAKLNIYGIGEIKKYQKMCDDCDGIKFHGLTDKPLAMMAESEVFVLPSYREGLSLSLLDAAMLGKKVIASDVDGNPEVIVNGETGILVPAKNVKKLMEAMIWMIENRKEAEMMAKKLRKRYEKYFNFKKTFEEKMLPLYNNEKETK